MDKLDALIAKVTELQASIIETIIDAIRENEALILDMNTQDQLYEKGIYRDGEKLDGYSPFTIHIKKQKGQPTNRTTLRDTGEFHESFYIEYTGDGFEIKASDPKTEELKEHWGVEIMGLSDENLDELTKVYVADKINEHFRNSLL